jgi:hypothetical protein
VVRALVLLFDGNQRWTQAAKVKKVLFAEKRKERAHGGHAEGPGNQWSLRSDWKLGFISLLPKGGDFGVDNVKGEVSPWCE